MKKIMTTIVATSLAVSLGSAMAAAAPAAQDSATGLPASEAGQTANARAVIQDARIEGMKAALKLTPDQEKYWTPFEAALRDSYKLHNQAMVSTRQAIAKDDPVQLLGMLSDNAAQGAGQLKKVAEAAKPLYDSLDPTQKRAFGPLLLTLRRNSTLAATRAQDMRQQLMQRWAGSESNTGQ